jgi:nucleoside-diphosphate-sugar epimerase
MSHLFCFGLGYSAQRVAKELASRGWHIAGTARSPQGAEKIAALGYDAFVFDGSASVAGVAEALAKATHVLVSAPPDADGDPVLRQHANDLDNAPLLSWIGYLSTVGVYGDSGGAWIDETMPTHATSTRGRRRIDAEQDWLALGAERGTRTQVFRLAGIYGPGRSAIDRLREGTAHRIVKPGQVFNRIHVDDIAAAVLAGIDGRGTEHVYNVTDDEPAPPQDVVAYAAELLHIPPPPETRFEDVQLTPMATSFYADNKRIRNARLRQDLGVALKFPTYREGLRAILADQPKN